jgi:hypothetical protein
MIRTPIAVFALIGLFISCAPDRDSETERENLLLATFLFQATRTPYREITPEPGSIRIDGAVRETLNFSPQCTGVEGNTQFKFYVKKGKSSNWIINFMGGGACWDGKNCLGKNTVTYFNQARRFSSLAARYAFDGIMDETNPLNPFKDWNVLFIPYCSGDLHWGSNSTTYSDPNTGSSVRFQHRGFENFLSTMKYLQSESDFQDRSSTKILVTGQSAGAYGAIFNFPYIKELFPNADAHVVGDAGNGIVPAGFQTVIDEKWGVTAQVPDWIGIDISDFTDGTLGLGEFYEAVADYYAGTGARVGQYTTLFDGNQRFFYNVQKLILGVAPYTAPVTYRDSRDLWGPGDGTLVPKSISRDWVCQTRNEFAAAAGASNYRSYIAGGDVHTISTSVGFFTERSAGFPVSQWYFNIISGNNWNSLTCENQPGGCNPPPSVGSVSCP